MIIKTIQTDAITSRQYTLEQFVDKFVPTMHEQEILVVTSKVVSLCEGQVIDATTIKKQDLVETEADLYLPPDTNAYGFCISVKNNTLIASAGIDESNGDGNFILWPADPQASVNSIRSFLCKKYSLHNIGVIMTDSHVLPFRWGTSGTAIAHSGFQALNSYIGKPDLFGRNLRVTYSNISEGLAAAAVVTMGEGNEATPFACIRDVPFVQFQDRDPSRAELSKLAISMQEDVFAPLLTAASWKKRKQL